jgi:hypothetical protein
VAIVTGASKKAFGKIDVLRHNFSISSSTKSANACAGSEFEKQVIGMTPGS